VEPEEQPVLLEELGAEPVLVLIAERVALAVLGAGWVLRDRVAHHLPSIYNVETSSKRGCVMQAVIRKWGNSPALRLPTTVMKEAGYQLEQKVELIVSRGRIVIQPSERVEYDLDALISGITADNVHQEVSFGAAVGHEAL
jgi:antitoxin MazE